MKRKEVMKAFNNSVMKLIYTLGYLLVPEPISPEYQLSLNNLWLPLRVVGLAIVSMIILTILVVFTIIAFFSIPFIFRPQPSQPWEK